MTVLTIHRHFLPQTLESPSARAQRLAREIADITVAADDLAEILVLRMLSNRLMKRIHKNYRFIVTFNAGLFCSAWAVFYSHHFRTASQYIYSLHWLKEYG